MTSCAMVLMLFGWLPARSADNASAEPASPMPGFPVDLEIPVPPTPVRIGGRTHLLYELHITNVSAKSFELTRLDVLENQSDGAPLASFPRDALEKLIQNQAAANPSEARSLGAASRIVVFLDIITDNTATYAHGMHHRLVFAYKKPDGAVVEKFLDGASVIPRSTATLVIQPPLRGKGWLAFDTVDSVSGDHRRSLIAVNGKARIAQRFATDWVKLGPDGRISRNDLGKNEDWYDYAAEVLAVANGVVADVKDGMAENIANSEPAGMAALEKIAGNYISLDLGNGRYAFYAHLKPGSLRVKAGDKVHAGQVLALLGNTGNSTGPHLHFHISDANSVLGSEGLPYVFASFRSEGVLTDPLKVIEKNEAWHAPDDGRPQEIRLELPANNALIDFP